MSHALPQRFAITLFIAERFQLSPFSIRARHCALALAFLFLSVGGAYASEPAASKATLDSRRLQGLVDRLRVELRVPQKVSVVLVASNPLKASVEPVKGPSAIFRLSIERGFLEQLTLEELRAVIAHELGHVWIFTHHPYLQTEQQANQIALRVISRESLVKVYGKVWKEGGPDGFPRLPDQQPAAGLGEPRLRN
jgi:hypothetical protein